MKLVRFTAGGGSRLGVVVGDEVADVTRVSAAIPADVGDLLTAEMLDLVASLVPRAPRVPFESVRLEAPIARPPSFLAVGLNYREHIDESGLAQAELPIFFNKQVTCVTGPYDPIVVPAAAPDHVDYEGELGVVIGTRCRAVAAARAHEVVAGYLVVNDVSVRDWQFATTQWTMGKGWDTHGPIGPWLVTPDEVPDPHALRLRTWVDAEVRQDSTTDHMIHDCWKLIEFLTTAFTLLPGTIVATGTPAGVGQHMHPPGMLHPGSRVRVEIEGIGAIDNPVTAEGA
jgi:2-keto-4-pentenoate hydratase/2-oxohepta-3-ene-1,7-dioic acid hydratase in catechol pathway